MFIIIPSLSSRLKLFQQAVKEIPNLFEASLTDISFTFFIIFRILACHEIADKRHTSFQQVVDPIETRHG